MAVEAREVSIPPRRVFVADDLHPAMKPLIVDMVAAADKHIFQLPNGHGVFKPFEGYRSPQRQAALLARLEVTKAGPWQSAHQYGLAVDFAIWRYVNGRAIGWDWSDKAPWGQLKDLARKFGMDVPIGWDMGHVQHPYFADIRKSWIG